MKRNALGAIAGGLIALAGCHSRENTVRFGEYTMKAETYNYLEKTAEQEKDPIDFDIIVDFSERSDTNQDYFLSDKEAKESIERTLEWINNY